MRHLISLGLRGDVAFQLRMHGGENVAHFFDWMVTPVEGLLKVLDADFDVCAPDHLELNTEHAPHHVRDRVTGLVFYHQFPLYGGHVQPDFLLFYRPFISKLRYLANRFREYARTRPVTFVRMQISEAQAGLLEMAFFACFPGADARFLYLNSEGEAFRTAHGHARIFECEGSLGDPIVWAAMLADEGLIDAPFRHSTAEILLHAAGDHDLSTLLRFTEQQLLAAIAANPRHAHFPLELATFYKAHGRWDEAEQMARLSLALAPDNPDAVFELLHIPWKSGRISAGDAADALVLLIGPERSEWLRETTAALLAAGRVAEARDYSVRAVTAAPLDSEAYASRAVIELELGNLEAAEMAIAAALRFDALHPYYQYLQGRVAQGLHRGPQAVTAFAAAYAVNRGPFYLNGLVEALAGEGRKDEAAAYVQEALSAPGADVAQIQNRWEWLIARSVEA